MEPKLLDDPVINTIAQRVHKTPAQVVLAWAVQRVFNYDFRCLGFFNVWFREAVKKSESQIESGKVTSSHLDIARVAFSSKHSISEERAPTRCRSGVP